MATVSRELTALVQQAAIAAGYGEAPVPLEPCVPTNDPRNGDYQSNYAFRMGKALRVNPREVAQAIADAIPANDLIASAEVAGPGFLNFRLSNDYLAAEVVRRADDPSLGGDRDGEGRTMVIDYSSPNIAKRMHVGHLRSTIIGNAIDRLHRFLGWHVIADNHVGDWGTQFGKLIVAWREWPDPEAYAVDPVDALQSIYQGFDQRAKTDPALEARARAETAALQEGRADNLALWQQFVDDSMKEFDRVYQRLDIHFDVVHGESHYRDQLQPLVDELLEQGLAEIDDGAVIVRFTDDDGKGLAKNPMLIRKSDGAALYGTSDLACVVSRLKQWDPDRIVYVTDVRQQLHFRQLFATCRRMGMDIDLQHVWFGMLRFPDGAVASTRKGAVLNLVDVLDTAVAHARQVVDAKSIDLSEQERAEIAETVGIGAVRYTDLSQNPQTDIVFDWDKMLSLEGNTAPYLMYAHARVHSIFRKGGIEQFVPGSVQIGEDVERQLAMAILRTPEIIEAAAATYRPNLLCEHLFQLANIFASFYHECRVLDPDQPALQQSRLSLCHATARTLAVGMDLVGLRALPRM